MRIELLIAFVLSVVPALPADKAPEWLRQTARSSAPQYDSKTPAVFLLSEMGIQIDKPGTIQTTTRHAVRILTREGRVHAAARALYQTDAGKVRELRAWMIFPPAASRVTERRKRSMSLSRKTTFITRYASVP